MNIKKCNFAHFKITYFYNYYCGTYYVVNKKVTEAICEKSRLGYNPFILEEHVISDNVYGNYFYQINSCQDSLFLREDHKNLKKKTFGELPKEKTWYKELK